MQERPAKRPMKSRALVAPGRQKEVYLAAGPAVMCLHLNEKARKGKREIQAELRGRGLCQAQTLEECISSSSSSGFAVMPLQLERSESGKQLFQSSQQVSQPASTDEGAQKIQISSSAAAFKSLKLFFLLLFACVHQAENKESVQPRACKLSVACSGLCVCDFPALPRLVGLGAEGGVRHAV